MGTIRTWVWAVVWAFGATVVRFFDDGFQGAVPNVTGFATGHAVK